MPKRMVDGEGLWLSPKVRSLPAEYRMHYANWLPLAEANGAFEVNTHQILVRVYSFLLPKITEKVVKKILNEFEKAGLLEIYEQKDKTWGYFTGIEKGGRLPPKSQLLRYKGLPPLPPRMCLGDNKDDPTDILTGFGLDRLGSGLDRIGGQKEESTDMAFIQNIERTARRVLKFTKDLHPQERRRFNAMKEAFTSDRVESDFEAWVEENRDGSWQQPFSAYLKICVDRLKGEPEAEVADDPRIRQVTAKVYEMTGRLPMGAGLIYIQRLLTKYETSAILDGFREYFNGLDTFEQKWAVKNYFTDGAAEIIIDGIIEKRKTEAKWVVNDAEVDPFAAQEKSAEQKAFDEETADQI